jgi:hypothetical protein
VLEYPLPSAPVVLTLTRGDELPAASSVNVDDATAAVPYSYILHREDVFATPRRAQ